MNSDKHFKSAQWRYENQEPPDSDEEDYDEDDFDESQLDEDSHMYDETGEC